MEQQEEKKIKISRRKRRRRQSSSSSKLNSSIPLDLLSEILLKLPAKSIVRFHSVSKLWSSITTDAYFINSYQTRFRPKHSLLVFFKQKDMFVVFSFPQYDRKLNGESYSSYSFQHVDRYQMKYPESTYFFSSMESVHGLICFPSPSKPIIWNPSKRHFLTLPKLQKSWRKGITVFLGYDPIEGKHKVVCMPDKRFCKKCMVLTLGSSSTQESWRRIKTNYHKPFTGINSTGRCVNGVLYYKADLKFGHRPKRVIMSFDVRSETFQPIRFPLDICDSLIAYEGRLAVVHSENNGKHIKMLILADAEKEAWSDKSFRLSLTDFDPSLETIFKLSGVTDGGELIYVPSTFLKSFTMLYYDPRRDSFRKVVFEGISDDEFRLSNRLGRSRLGNRRFYPLQAFPNHIDSPTTW